MNLNEVPHDSLRYRLPMVKDDQRMQEDFIAETLTRGDGYTFNFIYDALTGQMVRRMYSNIMSPVERQLFEETYLIQFQ